MPGEDSDDERERGSPPDPADRVWFHPSELTSFKAATRPRTTRASWKLVLTAVLGACVVVGVVVTAGVIGRTHHDTRTAASPQVDERLISAASASVVAVRVTRANGEGEAASGVCVGAGQVITSAHALEGASAVSVVTGQGATLTARALGADAATDVALLTVDGDVPAAKRATASSVRVGDQVIGLAVSGRRRWIDVAEVHALDRVVTWSNDVVTGLIETDLTAAGEHSGGALLDRDGVLVGILLVPPGKETAGYAMPIDVARDVGDQLRLNGEARHGWLGVTASDEQSARGGARVQSVAPASPADDAGVKRGDVIVALDDGKTTTAVSTMGQLMAEVRERRPGVELELGVYRDGARRHVTVELGDLPGNSTTGVATTATTASVGSTASQP